MRDVSSGRPIGATKRSLFVFNAVGDRNFRPEYPLRKENLAREKWNSLESATGWCNTTVV